MTTMTKAIATPPASALPLRVTLTADMLSDEEAEILVREAKRRKIPVDAVIARGAGAYARNLESRTPLTDRAHKANDPAFKRAFARITKAGEKPTAYRLALETGKGFRAAAKWLEVRENAPVRAKSNKTSV